MYRYETHLHTAPVSKCAKGTVRECLEYYKALGYDGVFITNHFLDGNINGDRTRPYAEQLEYFISDYEEGVKLGRELGIKVFFGAELAYKGCDFLVFGLSPDWFRAHPEIMEMKKSEELPFMREQGALIIHAHPFREAKYIDHIRLFPRCVDGVEVCNACRTPFENEMARQYAQNYGLLPFAGSDNHRAALQTKLSGMAGETPVNSVEEFITAVRNGHLTPFELERGEEEWN